MLLLSKKINVFSLVTVLSVIFFTSCSSSDDGGGDTTTDDDPIVVTDDDPIVEDNADFAMVTTVTNADGQTRAFYLQRVSIEDNVADKDNSEATELSAATGAMVHTFEGDVFFSDYANGRMEKWSIDEENNSTMEGSMDLSELGFQGNTAFRDSNTAFVGGLSTDIVIFNPSTMLKTGKIDFSTFSSIGTVTDFPIEGATIQSEAIAEIIIRDNYLYAAIFPLADVATFTPGSPSCTILVVDLDQVDVNSSDNSGAIVKKIYDERGSATGAWGSGTGASFMNIDENGDLYLLCHNFWANHRTTFDKPACVLKIASGSTDFDEDYYYDLESVARGLGSPVMNMEYYGDGKFLAAVMDPSAIDPNNPFSYYVDPIYQWYSFDLYNPTANAVIASENYTIGAVAAVSVFEDGFGYIPFQDADNSYVMRIDLNTLEDSRYFGTQGVPVLFSLE